MVVHQAKPCFGAVIAAFASCFVTLLACFAFLLACVVLCSLFCLGLCMFGCFGCAFASLVPRLLGGRKFGFCFAREFACCVCLLCLLCLFAALLWILDGNLPLKKPPTCENQTIELNVVLACEFLEVLLGPANLVGQMLGTRPWSTL